MEITFQYPGWFYIFCLLLGAAYAFLLYYHDRTLTYAENRKSLLYGLSALRFLVVSLIAFLLLGPLLRQVYSEEEKPVILLLQDESASIRSAWNTEDSLRYTADFQALQKKISDRFEVHTYAFGESLTTADTFHFDRKATNISAALSALYNLFVNRHMGAVILASDGIYNQGTHPAYSNTRFNVPLYTIALGDTTRKKDMKISRVYHNRIVYLGDRFEVEADVDAYNCLGESSILSIQKITNGEARPLQQSPIRIDRKNFSDTYKFTLDAAAPGIQHYRLVASPIAGEITPQNNVQDIFIEVLDKRQKVLIMAHAPHPDITAIKQSLEINHNYTVDIAFAGHFSGNIQDYSLVILHSLPSVRFGIADILSVINSKEIPVLYVVGSQTSLPAFNQAQRVVQITGGNSTGNEVQPIVNPQFSLFTIPEELKSMLRSYPPANVPYGDYSLAENSATLLWQKIGNVTTNYPLITFNTGLNHKIGVICGEGIWQWTLFNYRVESNHRITDELLNKSVQYLAVKDDKRRFRVILPKNLFSENESVRMDAEFYNKSYELINEPDVSLTITNDEGNEYPFTFNKTTNAYTLDAGYFPVGDYAYTASTQFDGQRYTAEGQFSITPVNLELLQTTADHNLLGLISQESGGRMFYPNQMDELAAAIVNADSTKPILRQRENTKPFINLKWVFFLLLALLTAEWFLRKYNGAY